MKTIKTIAFSSSQPILRRKPALLDNVIEQKGYHRFELVEGDGATNDDTDVAIDGLQYIQA